jgi:hypothetical protein
LLDSKKWSGLTENGVILEGGSEAGNCRGGWGSRRKMGGSRTILIQNFSQFVPGRDPFNEPDTYNRILT